MVKFIIEVGEDYIRANADSDKAKKNINNPLGALINLIGFTAVEKQIDKGKHDFLISPDKFNSTNEHAEEIFDDFMAKVCMLAHMCSD